MFLVVFGIVGTILCVGSFIAADHTQDNTVYNPTENITGVSNVKVVGTNYNTDFEIEYDLTTNGSVDIQKDGYTERDSENPVRFKFYDGDVYVFSTSEDKISASKGVSRHKGHISLVKDNHFNKMEIIIGNVSYGFFYIGEHSYKDKSSSSNSPPPLSSVKSSLAYSYASVVYNGKVTYDGVT